MTELFEYVRLHWAGFGSASILIVMSLFEVSKIKINPWGSLFQWIGKSVNKDLNDSVKEIKRQTEENHEAIVNLEDRVKLKFADCKKDSDTKEAKRLRANIIQFADSCRVGAHHTQNHFENIFRDYDDYIGYCLENSIENNFITAEIDYIRSVYTKCLTENKFI